LSNFAKHELIQAIRKMVAKEQQVNAEQISEKFIDLDEIIRNKNPRLANMLPGFILRYLKRVIHERELNEIIFQNRDKFGLDFINSLLETYQAKITVNGLENIPKEGRYILVSNHPLGGLDGIALMGVVGKVRKDIIFPVNDLLMNLPNLKVLFAPINKHGSNRENIKIIEDVFASDVFILYFPAGLVSRKHGKKIMDLEWKKSFILWASKHKRDIIPVYIEAKNTNFFYNLARLRAFFRIKQNIEMLYLVDEMFKQKDKDLVITIGTAVPYSSFDNSHTSIEWAKIMKEKVYSLKQDK